VVDYERDFIIERSMIYQRTGDAQSPLGKRIVVFGSRQGIPPLGKRARIWVWTSESRSAVWGREIGT